MKLIIIIISIFFGLNSFSSANSFPKDSLITFESPRSLIFDKTHSLLKTSAIGLDLDFSYFGFGAGIFWQKNIAEDWDLISDFTFSNVKNSDEFEPYYQNINEFYTVGKINRVYMFPLTVGIKKFLFSDELSDSFRPYLTLGGGPTFVLSTPYTRNRIEDAPKVSFFDSFSDMDWMTRFGFYIGVGSEFQPNADFYSAINIRYYYVHYGGNGIASMANDPMKSFQSIFLNLSIGKRY
jgi:hypothetical protein